MCVNRVQEKEEAQKVQNAQNAQEKQNTLEMQENAEKQLAYSPKDAEVLDEEDDTVGAYLKENLEEDIARYQAALVHTGFPNLEQQFGPLCPGMHVFGAPSGAGKTSFALQVAAQAAEQGRYVIYIGFERSAEKILRLVSQSMARRDLETALPTAYLRGHADAEESKGAMDAFAQTETRKHLSILYPTRVPFTPGTLQGLVCKWIEDRPQDLPLVIVDSLELVRPDRELVRGVDAVDEVVRGIHWACRKYEIPLLLTANVILPPCCIPADVTAFPDDSQLIDLASSVFVLQPTCLTDPAFQEKSVEERRSAVQAALNEVPCEMELVNLKNRNGPSSFSVLFDFYPQTGLFREQN